MPDYREILLGVDGCNPAYLFLVGSSDVVLFLTLSV